MCEGQKQTSLLLYASIAFHVSKERERFQEHDALVPAFAFVRILQGPDQLGVLAHAAVAGWHACSRSEDRRVLDTKPPENGSYIMRESNKDISSCVSPSAGRNREFPVPSSHPARLV